MIDIKTKILKNLCGFVSADPFADKIFLHKFYAKLDFLLAAITFAQVRVERCIFCDCKLSPGSEEHVFPASIGGRMRTRSATCVICNNSFAQGDKVDDAVGECFVILRCALAIWTGRDKPPPTIPNAGIFDNGVEYDLGPSFIPLIRAAKIPKDIKGIQNLTARDEADVSRVLDILEKRKLDVKTQSAVSITTKVPEAKLSINFDGNELARAITKTAITAACAIYGNIATRQKYDYKLALSSLNGEPDIRKFAGWDFWNPWPLISSELPHKLTKDTSISGFEHSILFADVNSDWIAYIKIFGHFRFTVRLGPASGLEPKGILLNPRALKYSRFDVSVDSPTHFEKHYPEQYKEKFSVVQTNISRALNTVLAQWQSESNAQLQNEREEELFQSLMLAGDNEEIRQQNLLELMTKWMTIDNGNAWSVDL